MWVGWCFLFLIPTQSITTRLSSWWWIWSSRSKRLSPLLLLEVKERASISLLLCKYISSCPLEHNQLEMWFRNCNVTLVFVDSMTRLRSCMVMYGTIFQSDQHLLYCSISLIATLRWVDTGVLQAACIPDSSSTTYYITQHTSNSSTLTRAARLDVGSQPVINTVARVSPGLHTKPCLHVYGHAHMLYRIIRVFTKTLHLF